MIFDKIKELLANKLEEHGIDPELIEQGQEFLDEAQDVQ
jgi:hypothetical protein